MTPKAARRLADWFHKHADTYPRHRELHRLMEDISILLHILAQELEIESNEGGDPPPWQGDGGASPE